jgi:hypothetical protein
MRWNHLPVIGLSNFQHMHVGQPGFTRPFHHKNRQPPVTVNQRKTSKNR